MHLEIVYAASPKRHQLFLESVKNRKYVVQGKKRKGVHSPFISEVKVYDVRIKKECVPQFLADYGIMAQVVAKPKGKWYSGSYYRVITMATWIFRKVFRLGSAKSNGKPQVSLPGHSAGILIGTIPDMEEDGVEIL